MPLLIFRSHIILLFDDRFFLKCVQPLSKLSRPWEFLWENATQGSSINFVFFYRDAFQTFQILTDFCCQLQIFLNYNEKLGQFLILKVREF